MSHLNLTELKTLLDYNPCTGDFYWKVKRKRANPGMLAGYQRKDGYWYIKINQVKYGRHILAWFYVTENWPEFEIDHKNRTPGDDWFTNLRDVPHQVNMQNRKDSRGMYEPSEFN